MTQSFGLTFAYLALLASACIGDPTVLKFGYIVMLVLSALHHMLANNRSSALLWALITVYAITAFALLYCLQFRTVANWISANMASAANDFGIPIDDSTYQSVVHQFAGPTLVLVLSALRLGFLWCTRSSRLACKQVFVCVCLSPQV